MIDTYVAELERRLPPDIADELADGVVTAYEQRLSRGDDPADAARATVDDFGPTDQVIRTFIRYAPGRRTARMFLATAPAVAASWALVLLIGQAWTWTIPMPVRILFGLTLLATIGTIIVASSTHDYAITRVAALGCGGLIVLDAGMIVTVLSSLPAVVWPMTVAVPASLARIGFAVRSLPRVLAT